MTSIVAKTRSPYMNLLQAVDESDSVLGSFDLGPCTGDDEVKASLTDAVVVPVAKVSNSLGPCVGDDDNPGSPMAFTAAKIDDALGPCVGDDNSIDNVLGPCVGDDGGISDLRLKRDIRPVETLPNGLQLYSFRYWNDDRTFVSVMAQDLMEDERFGHAVIEDESGYYKVNFAALGLGIEGSREQFREAGRKAIEEAEPAAN